MNDSTPRRRGRHRPKARPAGRGWSMRPRPPRPGRRTRRWVLAAVALAVMITAALLLIVWIIPR